MTENEIMFEAIKTLNLDFAKGIFPEAKEETLLIALHKSRYELRSMPDDLRKESGDWLRERGYGRLGLGAILPDGELP